MVSIEGDVATVGITHFAQKELGDIVYVEVETLDQTLEKMRFFLVRRGSKKQFQIYFTNGRRDYRFNEDLEATPETVNSDPYGAGWMIKKFQMQEIMMHCFQAKIIKC
jgi:glycine cleavage system H protein